MLTSKNDNGVGMLQGIGGALLQKIPPKRRATTHAMPYDAISAAHMERYSSHIEQPNWRWPAAL